ncbi:RluA family pseudouridine synthase [Paraclostridium sordellii]|uniref:RNA pseudouridylate synthase n=1 Tax=Paraclostridium sordellii TaxID=1505 RepID=A0A0C7R8T8_PARSO|nr:RluA family pseudouridine synthase [Paeniclostridium sordellii]QYE97953.1 RluA family pseudouridine synthase [Paeniclostridium sordellii]CEN80578.1 pseudouridine synthase RsuA-like [[Clostridium] sordellii] [Paeniclostridium sordellii]CEO15195.1 pseudouridine synthase RsuA-like [[Clostridium] sordellii] [Paeniclostridium sordellii]CEP90116.1 pseudouridine synthase RsuA-like [[Clostridium] sordellii] [Paeniclostridium sordellii]CEP98329.1 pseudouridine synthase RsuA-like [[Clostridium] sorde
MINVIYEDNHLLVVEKPVNVLSQGDDTNDKDMVNLLKNYLKVKYDKPGNVFVGLVHRLDRPVGGIMVFAKTSKAASRLSEQVRNKSFKKTYRAVLNGNMKKDKDILKDYLYKNKKTNMVSVVNKNHKDAKDAELSYETISKNEKFSMVQVDLKTGRPHQIRVQFSSRNHPLFGDQRYGQHINKKGDQIALWSYKIEITHPTTKEKMEFICNPPNKYPWNLFEV